MLIDEIERAGLLGRGGAAFPTATKMRAVASAAPTRDRRGQRRRGRAGEPQGPHAAGGPAPPGARRRHPRRRGGRRRRGDRVRVRVGRGRASRAWPARSQNAARRRPATSPRLHLTTVPGHYVAGQESALVNYLNGGPAKPTFTPPMPFEQGVRRRPTLVNNAETLAHVALIARHGAPWFRQLGTPTQPGSALVTLSGPVAHPGVYEIEHGASLSSLIAAGGGTTARVRGALAGRLRRRVGRRRAPERRRPVQRTPRPPRRLARGGGRAAALRGRLSGAPKPRAWPAGSPARAPASAGRACTAWTPWRARSSRSPAAPPQPRAMQRVERLASLVARRGACGHPDGAVNVILSALETFATEFADHAQPRAVRGLLAPGRAAAARPTRRADEPPRRALSRR